jgi:hypothetical protein
MNSPAIMSLSDNAKREAFDLAQKAGRRLAANDRMEDLADEELLAYAIVNEATLATAITELHRRGIALRGDALK